jgi:hypothetical protein
MMDSEKKPETRFKREKKLKPATVDFENIFFETVKEIAEETEKTRAQIMRRTDRRTGKARIRDQILRAETWPERDRLLRSLAAKCYDVANAYEGEPEKQLKWMRMVAKLLGLSFVPKRLEDLELIKRELAEVKTQMRELEEEGEEDGED